MANSIERSRGPVANIIAIVAIIAVVALGLWAAANLVRFLPNIFASIPNPFSRGLSLGEERTVAESGVPFTVAWEDKTREGGVYAFAYQCVEGVRIEIASGADTFAPSACDTPYQLASDARTIVLRAFGSGPEAEVPFALAYILEAEKADETSGTIVVQNRTAPLPNTGVNSGATSTPTTPAPKPVATTTPATKPATPTPSQPKQPVTQTPTPKPRIVNLAVKSLQTGVVDTNNFLSPRTVFVNYEMGAARFQVTNTGTVTSGMWRIIADLPTNPVRQYISPYQRGLRPGESFEFTVRFDRMQAGNPSVRVRVETAVAEDSNYADNYAAQMIAVY